MSEHSKRQLKNLIEQLEECCVFLHNGFSDFVEQVKQRTSDCLQNNIAFKEAIVVASTAHSTLLEHMDMLTESTKMYPRQEKTGEKMTTEIMYVKSTQGEKVTEGTNSDLLSRLEHLETTLAALQDTKQKTEDDIAELKQWRDNSALELKQWRDNSVTEHNDLEINIEKSSKKQKQNFKSLKKQLNEQDTKIMEINKVIENLKQRQSSTAEGQEKMSLDIKEHEKDSKKLNQNVQDLTDNFTQQIKDHSDLIFDLQEKEKNIEHKFDNLISKQAVMCKVLQQRLSPVDKLLQMFNQNSESREEKLKKVNILEKDVLKLSQDFHTLANQQVRHSTLGFVASGDPVVVERNGFLISVSYKKVNLNKGNHFDPKSGRFTAPVDGLYIVSLTIRQTGSVGVVGSIVHVFGDEESWIGRVETKDVLNVDSNTSLVWMKPGDVIYSYTFSKGFKCTHFSCFLLGI